MWSKSLIGQHNNITSASDTVELPQVSQVKAQRTLLTPMCLWMHPEEHLHCHNTWSHTVSLKCTDVTHLQVVFPHWRGNGTDCPFIMKNSNHLNTKSSWSCWCKTFLFPLQPMTNLNAGLHRPFTVQSFAWTVVCSEASTWTGIQVFSYTVTTGCVSFNSLLNTLAGSMQTEGRDEMWANDLRWPPTVASTLLSQPAEVSEESDQLWHPSLLCRV